MDIELVKIVAMDIKANMVTLQDDGSIASFPESILNNLNPTYPAQIKEMFGIDIGSQ